MWKSRIKGLRQDHKQLAKWKLKHMGFSGQQSVKARRSLRSQVMQTRHVTDRETVGKVYYDVHEGPRMADVQPRPEP